MAAAALVPATPAHAVVIPDTVDELAPIVRMADRAHERAARRHVRLHRTNAKLRGDRPERRRAELTDWSLDHLRDANWQLEKRNKTLRRRGATTATGPAVAVPAHLQAIAACESGGNPQAVGGGGAYRGKYQFDLQTWASVGGSGDPAAAPEAEQDRRAAMLYAQAGASPWPVCGA